MVEQAQLVEGSHHGLAGLVAAHAAEAAEALHHMGCLVEYVHLGQASALAHGEVVGVMGRGDLHRARAEGGVHVEVGEDGNLAVDQRQLHRLAHQALVALVGGVHSHASVAQHGLGARGGHHQVLHAVHWLGKRVTQVPQVPGLVLVFRLVVGDGGGAAGAPVDDALAAVDDAVVVPVDEHAAHGAAELGAHGELLVSVVAGAAHGRYLLDDAPAIVAPPFLARLDECLAPYLAAVDALGGQVLVHLGLRGDARVVGTQYPAGLEPPHARTTDASVLDGVVQGMAHMQHAGDVGRRYDDGVGLAAPRAEARRSLEAPRVPPLLEDGPLHGGVTVALLVVLSHRAASLSLCPSQAAALTRPSSFLSAASWRPRCQTRAPSPCCAPRARAARTSRP